MEQTRCADYCPGDCAGELEECADGCMRCDAHADSWEYTMAQLEKAKHRIHVE